MFKKPAFFLILGLLLLVVGVSVQKFAGDYYNSQRYYSKIVQERLEQELLDLEFEMIPVLDSVSTTGLLTFNSFNLENKYPYFIFRNSELKLWSDYNYTPNYELIAGDYSIKIIKFKNSTYLVRKWFSRLNSGNFEVVSLIPIIINYAVENKYLVDYTNNDIFKTSEIEIYHESHDASFAIVIRGETLFWLESRSNHTLNNATLNAILFIIFLVATIFLVIAAILKARGLAKKRGNYILIVSTILVWLGIKISMNLFSFPGKLLENDIFDSRFFYVSWFERSFGDMFLNTIFILILSIILYTHFRFVKNIRFSKKYFDVFYSALLVFILNLVINYQYLQLRTIYFNSQISLDITKSLSMDSLKVLSVLIFVIISVSTALLFHIVFKRLEAQSSSIRHRISSVIIGSLLFILMTYSVNLPIANLLIITTSVIILFFASGLQKSLQQGSNSVTLYILFWIILEAVIGGWCITEFEGTRETNKMVRYAQSLSAKNDYMAEFMISEVMDAIRRDPSISARLNNPFLSKEYITKKISRGYLNKYLDKYNASIYLYTPSGEGIPGFGTTLNYFAIKSRYALMSNETEFSALYILTRDFRSLAKHYMAFIPMLRYNNIIGYIILDFHQKRLIPQNVYPELLVDSRFIEYQSNVYSYGIFEGNTLIQSSGGMDYGHFTLGKNKGENPWIDHGYKHYLLTDSGGDTIIVGSKYYFFKQVFSNSSFLLTSLLLPIILLLAFYLIYQMKLGHQIAYSTKTQLFLNLAFFVPLAIVTITTLSFITTSFRQELIDGKLRESARLAVQIEQETDAFLVNISAKDILTDKLLQLANYGDFDATIYGSDGQMITTTQANIFSSDLQSDRLNPQAVISLIEGTETNTVVNEKIGSLKYYATYSAIRSRETNRLLGVLSIPFFRAERTIESNQIEALTTILNVFVLIFILALITTFQTSKWLTAPLLLIRKKMGQTSFSEENTPIEWHSDDEIGELIGEYNNMLIKLEASKEALTRSQRESAWREVAQQVAHEIKNPITPMKLTLQKLERVINTDGKDSSKEIIRTVKNLLSQLQMLNDIVTSFSEFAKMPIPKNEEIDLALILKELKILFNSQDHINLQLHLHSENVYISADRELMSRILSNIIINAGQSKRQDQEIVDVEIDTDYDETKGTVQVRIKDNGSGIDTEVVERVFVPRFSTKKEGSGIGLAVAKHGVENAGGTIWFETEQGRGTTFFLQFPELE